MEKREVSKGLLSFLRKEIQVWQQEGLIGEEAGQAILGRYEARSLNFVKVVVTIGALLVGLGILSFIASNWDAMSRLAKFSVILGLYAAANGVGYRLTGLYPKTGRSLIYLGALIYGAGIFLVGQMFNLGGNFSGAFLLWSAGILPMAWLDRDQILYVFAQILMLVYILGGYEIGGWSPWVFVAVPGLYALNTRMGNPRTGTFFNTLTLFAGLGYVLVKLDVEGLVAAGLYLLLGALLVAVKLPVNREIFRFQGGVCFGIAGLFITGKSLWSQYALFGDGVAVSIVFAILFVLVLLAYVRQGSLTALVFVCATILRFYFDTFFDFMPKSFFFIIGGLMLLGFGFYFERMRSRKGGLLNE